MLSCIRIKKIFLNWQEAKPTPNFTIRNYKSKTLSLEIQKKMR